MNILILNVSAGFGHKSVSGSLQSDLANRGQKVYSVDILEYVNPTINKLFQSYYIKSLKYIPEDLQSRIYEKEIDEALKKNRDRKQSVIDNLKNLGDEFTLSEVFNKMIAGSKIEALFKELQPDIVISTHPFIGDLMDVMYREALPSFKLVTVVTDYVVHPSWLNETSDYFIFPSEYLKYDLETIGCDMTKIRFYGLPIHGRFCLETFSEKDSTRFTYLVMGGGNGLGKMKHYVELLFSADMDVDVIVLCGNNEDLRDELEQWKREKGCKNLFIHGFTNEVHKIMSRSDVLISKPGGVTLTEAMQMELPIIIKDFLPGQEERNTRFILNNHIGVYASNDMDFISCCRRLREDGAFRENIIKNMRRIAKKDTLQEIYLFLKSLVSEDRK